MFPRTPNRRSLRFAASRARTGLILPTLALAAPLAAGELKVDINRDSRNDPVTHTEPGYTRWSPDTTNAAATGLLTVSRSFTTATGEAVTVTLGQTELSQTRGGTGILSNWYQAGALGTTAKLVSDGITVAPANLSTGGQLRMTITGLAAGTHTLLTYHNAWDNLVAGTLGPIDIFVTDLNRAEVQVVDNLQPTIRAATNSAATSAYIEFEVAGPSSVTTFLFSGETVGTAPTVTIRNAMINGFEIDTPNATRIAINPSPADSDEHVNADSGTTTLSWSPALSGTTVSHDVYFGTDRAAVKAATRSSPAYLGNQTTLSRTVPTPDKNGTYYWRIDQVDTLGNITAGTVWYFRPRMLAFPGAEGYGRFARGGRGGRVVRVTSLADYGSSDTPIPGTLRYAVEQEQGPRIIVFDVGGLITLPRRLTLASPYVTIAGQTAPGKGICTRGYALGLSGARDAVVRYLRNRPGNITGATIDGGGLAGCDHSIMDHCSTSWSIDEGFSSRNAKNITLQNTLISEALNIAGHQNYPAGTAHGYAATISGDVGSFLYNLLAHCEGRNWSLGGGLDPAGFFAGRLDIRNNVVYNWRGRTTDGGAHKVNFVANYYKKGAATTKLTALNAQYDNFPGTQQYYMAGNVMPGQFDESNQAAGRTVSGFVPTTYPVFVETPFFPSYATERSARAAYKVVLSNAGANRPRLDDHDARVIQETLNGTYTYTGTGPYGGYPGLPNSQDDVGGWENYPEDTRPAGWDSDSDGLPDWWEELHGTDPRSPSGSFADTNADPEGDGYTRMDDFLDWLALPRLQTHSGSPVEIDLSTLTVGFTSAPVRTVALAPESSASGSITLLADGKTARFTPAPGFSGLARFTHNVTDSQGDSWSSEVGVRVTAVEQAPVAALARRNGNLEFDFMGIEGQSYRFEHSTDLSVWTQASTVLASGAVQRVVVPPELTSANVRFFRFAR